MIYFVQSDKFINWDFVQYVNNNIPNALQAYIQIRYV